MQHNYEYLKDSSEALFNLTLVAGRKFEFSLDYSALYEDLRTIEDNYRLLKIVLMYKCLSIFKRW